MGRQTQTRIDQLARQDRCDPGTRSLIDAFKELSRLFKPRTGAIDPERRAARRTRLEARRETARIRRDLEQFMDELDRANDELREVADTILVSSGYRRHDRGDWHLADDTIYLKKLWKEGCAMIENGVKVTTLIDPAKYADRPAPGAPTNPTSPMGRGEEDTLTPSFGGGEKVKEAPRELFAQSSPHAPREDSFVTFHPPRPHAEREDYSLDPETQQLLAAARAGDATAQERVRELCHERAWAERLGDLGAEATRKLLDRAAATDPGAKIALEEFLGRLTRDLLGSEPSVLETLLARRVVNGWLVVHALEKEFAGAASKSYGREEFLDRCINRAQGRMVQAIRELARVRRLRPPLPVRHAESDRRNP